MSIYTVKEISTDTGLTRRMVLKHLNGSILPAKKNHAGYEIDDEIYKQWSTSIPNIEECENNTGFAMYENSNYAINNQNLIEDIDVSECMDDIVKGFNVETESNLTFADFFSGAGGISCGFAAAGYRPLVFVDNFREATKTYREYFSNRLGFKLQQDRDMMDITEEQTKNYVIELLTREHPYVICGGFPCQGFSLSGTSIATDPRNTLYSDMLDIVRSVLPEYIVMENVTGIRSMLHGGVIKKIVHDYAEIGYTISWKILDAADYGVAQHRKRIIFIGNRIRRSNLFPIPIRDESNYKTVEEAIGKYAKIPENKEINHIFSKHSEKMKERLNNVEIGKTLYDGYSDSWKKCSPSLPSCTIKENHGATNIHYSEPRVITPREMAALQSFPENFIFQGNKSMQLKQIGNAVPPMLAKAIALALKGEIRELAGE